MCCKVCRAGAISKTETARDSVGGTQDTLGDMGLVVGDMAKNIITIYLFILIDISNYQYVNEIHTITKEWDIYNMPVDLKDTYYFLMASTTECYVYKKNFLHKSNSL